MACGCIDWAETLRHTGASLLRSIDRRDENDVTLVTLYIFEVLHEKGFERAFPAFTVTLGVIVMGKEPIHLLGQHLTLCLVDGDNAEGARRVAGHECLCRFGDCPGLQQVDACLRGVEAIHLTVFDTIVVMPW